MKGVDKPVDVVDKRHKGRPKCVFNRLYIHSMHNREKGMVGEDVACKFLVKQEFVVVARNYRKKWGELDIVAEKEGVTHVFEVKSTTSQIGEGRVDVHQPEHNVDSFKSGQIRRMIQTYFAEKGMGPEFDFKFHVLSVFVDLSTRRARVKWIKDVIL